MRVKAGFVGFALGAIVITLLAQQHIEGEVLRRLDLRIRAIRRSEAIRRGERDADEI